MASINALNENSTLTSSQISENRFHKEKLQVNVIDRGAVHTEENKVTVTEEKAEDILTEVKKNLEQLNEYIPVTSTNLIFEFDELGDPPIIKVLDQKSQEVIREIPSKEFREVAKALDEFADKLSNKGLIFNKTV